MAQIGYKLSSEEHGPNELVRDARMAEDVGFGFALIRVSVRSCGASSVRLPTPPSNCASAPLTCSTVRLLPAVVAQTAATAAVMLEGRFFLGWGRARTSTST